MKRREAVAFVIGATTATIAVFTENIWAWPIQIALGFLNPGFWVSLPLLGLFSTIGQRDPFLLVVLLGSVVLTNGLFFALASYLMGIAFDRGKSPGLRMTAFVPAVVAVAFWANWYVRWRIDNTPKPEFPIVIPLDSESPLVGRWEGVSHGHRGDVPVILVCRPRIDRTLDGVVYLADHIMGPIENGICGGDSLRFDVGNFAYRGHLIGDSLAVEYSISRDKIGRWMFHFVSADTTIPRDWN